MDVCLYLVFCDIPKPGILLDHNTESLGQAGAVCGPLNFLIRHAKLGHNILLCP